MLKWKIFRYKTVAISWFIIMCILFFLPGSALPKEKWLEGIYFDKWVHVGLFAILVFLWRSAFDWDYANYNLIILLSAVLYGFAVEIIQLYWISNRSFDLFDLLADTIGSIVGLLVFLRVYKKINPCRNRGRNQN
jgi:hypothetical protein